GAAGDGHRLAELRRRVDIVDAAADQAGGGQDRAVLPLVPAVAHANGAAVGKLHWAGDAARKDVRHGKALTTCLSSPGHRGRPSRARPGTTGSPTGRPEFRRDGLDTSCLQLGPRNGCRSDPSPVERYRHIDIATSRGLEDVA